MALAAVSALTACGFGDGAGGGDTDPNAESHASDRGHPDLIPPGTYYYRDGDGDGELGEALDTVRVTVNENWCNFTYTPDESQVFSTACTLLPDRKEAVVAGDVYDRDGELLAEDGEFLFSYENATTDGFDLHAKNDGGNDGEYVRLTRRGA